ncbi:MAG: hypothetical protein K2Q18_14535 [Bdellovibrionales bacterium]|nr:hypothetical protein [Bdellovibrionales bacterium]
MSNLSEASGCAGVNVGGYCWYYGHSGESCGTVCTNHGGYNEATETYAGVSGTNAACTEVSDALGVPAASMIDTSCSVGYGCAYFSGFRIRCNDTVTTETASRNDISRVCACNE